MRKSVILIAAISPTYRYFLIFKIPVIFNFNHKLIGWIWTYGFALIIFLKPHFSDIQFDTLIKNEIGFRYPYSICNILRKFDIWVSLNISPSDDFFGIWQLFFIYSRLGNLTKDKFFTGLWTFRTKSTSINNAINWKVADV